MDNLTKECAAYFLSIPGFQRIMQLLLVRYRRNGYAAGTIHLEDATDPEREALRRLFGRPFYGEVKIKVQDFELALQESRFLGVSLKAVLEAYFQTQIYTRKETKAQKDYQLSHIVEAANQIASTAITKEWLAQIHEKQQDSGYLLLRKEMSKNLESAQMHLCKAVKAGNALECGSEPLRLAVFSAQATTDPHAMDSDTLCGQMFLHLLAKRVKRPFPSSAEDRDLVYFENGILCDSISSVVTQVGLILNEPDQEHPAFRELRLRHQCCTLSLTNLNTISSAQSPSGKAFLVENQMLFSQMADQANRFHSPLICTSGQLQVAVLRLLDMLVDAGTALYYAGDFDGGGLSIAAKLLARYPENILLWHMAEDDYMKCKSEVPLSEASKNMMKATSGTTLKTVAEIVAATGYAGYQELLLERLVSDLIRPESLCNTQG